ncbi:MAG: M28 family peptidase [Planctomycetes bacterium]|nr:M28 family peptidase [Planctomycetota bacterium]
MIRTRLRSVLPAALAALTAGPWLAAQSGAVAALPDGAPAAMAQIDVADLRRHAFHLAGDELMGRHTGTPGQLAAAQYIAEQLQGFGCEPLGDEQADGTRSFLQSWPVVSRFLDPTRTGITLGVMVVDRHFAVFPGRSVDDVSLGGRLVDCRYGAESDLPAELGPGDVPFVLLRTIDRPRAPVQAQFQWGFLALRKAASIARNLERRGARIAVFGMLHDDSGVGEMLTYSGLVPGKPILRYEGESSAMIETLATDAPLVFLPAAPTRAALELLGYSVGDDDQLAMAGPPPAEAPVARVDLRVVTDPDARAVNVVGVLRGGDAALRDEAVVFSSHMDHMGLRMDGSIFHGADDNASGSAAMLECAQAFAEAARTGQRPRRSVIFLSVSGEELGLWGSKFFADHSPWPLDRLVADVNIDMIGRFAPLSGPGEISITPSYRHRNYSSIAQLAARLAPQVGLGLTIGDEFYTRSDHYNFAVRGIPVVFFCDGEHEDYHQVTDSPERLEYGKIEQVARLAFWTGLTVANGEGRPREVGRRRDWLDDVSR